MTTRTCIRRALQWCLRRLLQRSVVLLPNQANIENILKVQTDYGVKGERLITNVLEEQGGTLVLALRTYHGHMPSITHWHSHLRYDGPSTLCFDVVSGEVRWNGAEIGRVAVPLPTRRFCWELRLEHDDGVRRERLTGHYLPGVNQAVAAEYFQGDNYVDYEAQSQGEAQQILDLLEAHQAEGPILEIGCATGQVLEALRRRGYAAWGVDFSEWAVEQAAKHVGPEAVAVCNVEQDSLPADIQRHGPFQTLVLWFVLEHFKNPFDVLESLTQAVGPDATLIIGTTNSESLTHRLFQSDWEGYFDRTHHGVDAVSISSLRQGLPHLGWQIQHLRTDRIWNGNADPTCATLREWWAADARFRQLLSERDMGDLMTCVAKKSTRPESSAE